MLRLVRAFIAPIFAAESDNPPTATTATMDIRNSAWQSSSGHNDLKKSFQHCSSQGDKLTLEEKLHRLGRPHLLAYFRELRDGNLKNSCFKEADELLKAKPLSIHNCSLAIRLAATVLWPRSCQHRPISEPRGFSLLDASLRRVIALVLVDQNSRTNKAALSMSIINSRGQFGQDICSISRFYNIFDAVLDCEITYSELRRKTISEVGFNSPLPCRQNKDRIHFRSKSLNKVSLINHKEWAKRHQKQPQVERWIHAHKARETATRREHVRSRDGSTGRLRTNLPHSPLRTARFPFDFDVRFTDWSAGLNSSIVSEASILSRPKAITVLRGVPGCREDANVVKNMMVQAIAFLETRNVSLAEDVRNLKARMFREMPRHERSLSCDGSSSSVKGSSAGKPTRSKDAASDQTLVHATRDEIHIVCSDAPTGINIYVFQESWGTRKWFVSIHLQLGTRNLSSDSTPNTANNTSEEMGEGSEYAG